MSCRMRPWLSRLHAALLAFLLIGQIPPVVVIGAAAPHAWQTADICLANPSSDPAPAPPVGQHHDHCALCLTLAGPMLPPDISALPVPTGFAQSESIAPVRTLLRLLAHRPYAPRAPPMMV